MAERSKRRGRKLQVSQVRSLMEGIGGDGCGADGSTDTECIMNRDAESYDIEDILSSKS